MITFEYPELKSTATHLKQVTAEEHFRQQCAAREDAIRRENSLKFGMEAAKKESAELKIEMSALKDENNGLQDEIINLKDEVARLKAELDKTKKM